MSSLSKPNSMRRTPDAKLNITSMMDMFTIILVFLLFSFSSEKEPTIDGNLVLPESTSRTPYRDAITLSLSKTELKVNGESVLQLSRGMVPGNLKDGDKVLPLFEVLIEEKKKKEENPDKENPVKDTLVLFQADRNAEFSEVDPIMKTAGMAGFPNFRFAVMRTE